MSPKIKLVYHSGRGRAEGARLIMAAGVIEYENVRITPEEWVKMKPGKETKQIYGTNSKIQIHTHVVHIIYSMPRINT